MRHHLLARISAAFLVAAVVTACSSNINPNVQLEKLTESKGTDLAELGIGYVSDEEVPSVSIKVIEAGQINEYFLNKGEVALNFGTKASTLSSPTAASDFNIDEISTVASNLQSDGECYFASATAISTPKGIAIEPSCQGMDGLEIPRDELSTLNGKPAFAKPTPLNDATAITEAAQSISQIKGTTKALSISFRLPEKIIHILTPATPDGLPCATQADIYETRAAGLIPKSCFPSDDYVADSSAPTMELNETTLSSILETIDKIKEFPISGIESVSFEPTESTINWTVTGPALTDIAAHPEYTWGSIPRP